VNFLVNLRILLDFDPFSFTNKGIKWPSLIESKHVIVPRKSNKHIYDFHGLFYNFHKRPKWGLSEFPC
jgi:hypothetical protein